ncbi:MAG: GNAT family N-acetyltransferase [Desulfobacteraceae bacterium]|jgi:ribosomal protein S18 acetylase RimI-like enzyme
MSELDNLKIRNGTPIDHEKIVSVMPEWWDGRDLSSSVLKVFFVHFKDTIYIAEIRDQLVGFLVGFMSQSEEKVGYIHFAGVHPKFRRASIGRLLYEHFYAACNASGKSLAKSCTSPFNKLSINFHLRMGFEIEPGDGIVDDLPVTLNFFGNDNHMVLFKKTIS